MAYCRLDVMSTKRQKFDPEVAEDGTLELFVQFNV